MARTWFITGVNSGFGREMTEQLLERGDRIAGTIRQVGSVTDLQARYGDQLWITELDLTDTAAIHTVVDRAFARFGTIDVVVNNAGYGLFGAAEELTDEQINHQIATNLVGSIQVVRAALPHLRKQGGGRIIQISSYGGQATHPGASLYHASKWGIEGFIESVAKEVAPFNIEATIVAPGGARTNFRSSSSVIGAPMAAYDGSPASMTRGIKDLTRPSPGDAGKMVRIIIESLDQSPAPSRIALGSDAYRMIHKTLSERLAELEAQKTLAISTDIPTTG